jgi:RimJ/RimL family protein N-acetyltransferase
MITGEKLSLRALEKDDLIQLKDWRNNENFRKFFREYRELSMDNQLAWFENYVIKDNRTLMFGIVENKNNLLIGVNGLCYIDWINRNADLSLYIGFDDIYIDTYIDGYAWQSLDLLFEYGFNRLNLHKVWTEIYSFDEKKHDLYEKYGFHRDAVLRDNYFYDGKYQDSHIYSILADDWRNKK